MASTVLTRHTIRGGDFVQSLIRTNDGLRRFALSRRPDYMMLFPMQESHSPGNLGVGYGGLADRVISSPRGCRQD